MRIKFTNNSVSGIHRQYPTFALEVPGSATVILDVPDELVEDVKTHLSIHQPAIEIEENPAEEAAFGVFDDQAEADRVAAEKAAAEAKEQEEAELAAAEALAKEEAEKAEADRVAAEKAATPTGGKKK